MITWTHRENTMRGGQFLGRFDSVTQGFSELWGAWLSLL